MSPRPPPKPKSSVADSSTDVISAFSLLLSVWERGGGGGGEGGGGDLLSDKTYGFGREVAATTRTLFAREGRFLALSVSNKGIGLQSLEPL